MRILHSADWHLGDRLRHVDRTGDLCGAVEQVAAYCHQCRADVLLVAGDLFSELARPDTLQAAVAHLSQTFRSFLLGGGTIVALAGNHDSDVFCQTLRRAFQLAAPVDAHHGDLLPGGRFYLAAGPVHFRLADQTGQQVQLVCLPYPTASRYPGAGERQQDTIDERNRAVRSAYLDRLRAITHQLKPELPRILATHVTVVEADSPKLFRLSPKDDILIPSEAFAGSWAYVALGHLHGAQRVSRQGCVHYSGSIERLDMGERDDRKGVIRVDVRQNGVCGQPHWLPVDATPFYDVQIRNARLELPLLAKRYPAADRALVRCHVQYQPGHDNLPEILAELSRIFPRCYERTWTATKPWLRGPGTRVPAARPFPDATDPVCEGQTIEIRQEQPSLEHMVLGYLEERVKVGDPDRDELLGMARRLLEQDE
jgi:DNA repair protein SbcD/Mre11